MFIPWKPIFKLLYKFGFPILKEYVGIPLPDLMPKESSSSGCFKGCLIILAVLFVILVIIGVFALIFGGR